jgi:addiction module HigA family antidote
MANMLRMERWRRLSSRDRGLSQVRVMEMPKREIQPVHPGEILLEEFLKPMGLSQNRLALSIGVHPRRINEIVLGKRGITADTALRLAKFFGTSPELWLGLQKDYELDVAMDEMGERINREVHTYASIKS